MTPLLHYEMNKFLLMCEYIKCFFSCLREFPVKSFFFLTDIFIGQYIKLELEIENRLPYPQIFPGSAGIALIFFRFCGVILSVRVLKLLVAIFVGNDCTVCSALYILLIKLGRFFVKPAAKVMDHLTFYFYRRQFESSKAVELEAMSCILQAEPGSIVFHNKKWWLVETEGLYTAVTLSGGTFNRSTGKIEAEVVTRCTETLTSGNFTTAPGECALAGVSSQGVPSQMAKGSCLVWVTQPNGALTHWSSCLVLDNILVMARHNLRDLYTPTIVLQSNIVQNGKKKTVEIPLSRAYNLDKQIKQHMGVDWDDTEHVCSAFDMIAIPLSADELSKLGISSWSIAKNICRSYASKRCRLTYAENELHIALHEGTTAPKDPFVHELGLGLAAVHSICGASSSPLVVCEQGLKLAGMWLGQPTRTLDHYQGKYNLFLTVDCIIQNLKAMGLYACPWEQSICDLTDKWISDLKQSPAESTEPSEADDSRSSDDYYVRTKQEWRRNRTNQRQTDDRRAQDAKERDEIKEDIDEKLHGGSRRRGESTTEVTPTMETMAEEIKQMRKLLQGAQPGHSKTKVVASLSAMTDVLQTTTMTALNLVRDVEQLSIDSKCIRWKLDIVNGRADEAFSDIYQWNLDTVDDGCDGSAIAACRQRCHLIINSPCNTLTREYLKSVVPDFNENPEDFIDDKDGKVFFSKIGQFETKIYKKKVKPESKETDLQKDIKDLAEKYHEEKSHGCDLGRYVLPVSNKTNIEKSMRAQVKRISVDRAPIFMNRDGSQRVGVIDNDYWLERTDFRLACEYVEKQYNKNKVLIKTHLEEGQTGLFKVFAGLSKTSPGITGRYISNTKKDWVERYPNDATDLAVTRLILIAACGADIKYLSPRDMIELGLKDVQDVFMKTEVHSPAKMAGERYRLIWISSLIDIIVQALVHKADNTYMKESFQKEEIDCAAIGLGHDDVGVERLVRAFQKQDLHRNISCDATCFDLSVDFAFIEADAIRRAENIEGNSVAQFVMHFADVLSKHVLNNCGDVWECHKLGVTTSGFISTTSQNTFARSVQARYAGCRTWVAAGDDLVADELFDSSRLLDLGVSTRDQKHNVGETHFTSHKFNFEAQVAQYENVEKMLWSLYHKVKDTTNNSNRLGAVLWVLRNTDAVRDDLTGIIEKNNIDITGKVFNNEDILREFE